MRKILVVYKSVTGFTADYAQLISQALGCPAAALKDVSSEKLARYDTIIFGGRLHAGFVDGLKELKALFARSGSQRLVIFATGATPNSQTESIAQAWANNLTAEELEKIPHFYMQSGLRYENMPLGDRLMMRVFAAMVKRKKEKSEYEKMFEQAIASSYDISSEEYALPLINYIKEAGV